MHSPRRPTTGFIPATGCGPGSGETGPSWLHIKRAMVFGNPWGKSGKRDNAGDFISKPRFSFMGPVLEIRDYSYRYPGREKWALSHLSLSVAPGECICLSGPSGCGKSTLFLALKGLLKDGHEKGTLRVGESHRIHSAGLVFQNAESHLLCTTVADEVAFGPQNLGLGPREIETVVQKSLETVALNGFDARNARLLSACRA